MKSRKSTLKIFIDLDGVLTDFEESARQLFPGGWKKLSITKPALFWRAISNKGPKFWSEMAWLRGGKQLWSFLKKWDPIILSAYPREKHDAVKGKKVWIRRELSKKAVKTAILCPKKQKIDHAGTGNILIDDNKTTIRNWIKAGGIGILHKDAKKTIQILEALREG